MLLLRIYDFYVEVLVVPLQNAMGVLSRNSQNAYGQLMAKNDKKYSINVDP